MSRASDNRAAYLLGLEPAARAGLLERMSQRQRLALRHHWRLWAHQGQLPPKGQWQTWLILAGRGFGKTRAGAEWVRAQAQANPAARIALVGATLAEARSVMVEGDSGLLAIAPRGLRPRFEPSRRLLTWPNGAQAMLYSAIEPESLRGPQHSHACRTGPEGGLSQRVPGPPGRAIALRDRGANPNAACHAARWSVLAGRFGRHGRMAGSGRQDRLLSAGAVALRFATGRSAVVRPQQRPGPALRGDLEKTRKAVRTGWRSRD